MDPFAENYNPNANVNDNRSCTYKTIEEPITGCMDTLALNYNPVATVSNASCIYPSTEPQVIYGCTDRKSLNYNPRATDYDGSCVYAEEENIFNDEIEETPVDTIGTKPIENCALSINVAITNVSISRVDVLNPHEVKVHWVIELEGGITILYSANYEVSQSGVTLFYLSIICKDGGALRAKSLRSASSEAGVTGFTVSATADVKLETTGICQPKETANFAVYPNPANNTLNVRLENNVNNGTLTLFDMSGKIVLSQAVNGNSAQVNMSSLTAGNYILRLVENGTASAGIQIIKN